MPSAAEVVIATPLWAVLPFACYLLLIAVLPLFFGHFWESNRNKLLLGLLISAPVIVHLLGRPGGAALLGQTVFEYVSFIALLGALFVISGGIYLRGSLTGTPIINTLFMAIGARLATPWALVNGILLLLFALFDLWAFRRDGGRAPLVDAAGAPAAKEPLRLEGRINILWLAGIVLTVFACGTWGPALLPNQHARSPAQLVCMLALALASLRTTARTIHVANRVSRAPIVGVGVAFAGIIPTTGPALLFLE